jgi:DNA-directed RNA polymerase sigma subunit (sigma70/sigma32)
MTQRIPRPTNTDRLNACNTWQEVVDCPLYDDWIKTISFNPGIYHPKMQTEDPIESNLSRARYELLCDTIDGILTKEEQKIFYSIAEESKSLRVVAKELNCSYEKVRQVFIRCQNKIKENPDVQRIQSGSN